MRTELPTKVADAKSVKDAALRWFASLPLDSRRCVLTVGSKAWTQMVLKMASQLRTSGHGRFFVLDEVSGEEEAVLLPFHTSNIRKSTRALKASQSGTSKPSLSCQQQLRLPKVCFKEDTGLFARLHEQQEAAALLESSLRFLSSQSFAQQDITVDSQGCEDDGIAPNWLHLDTVTLSDEFLSDCNRLFHVLDVLSWGGFLTIDPDTLLASTSCKDHNGRSSSVRAGGRRSRGEGGSRGTAVATASGKAERFECDEETWEELPWLKSLGFYSLAAFVTNRLDLCLRGKWAEHTKEASTRKPTGRENGRGRSSSEGVVSNGEKRLLMTSRIHEHVDAVIGWCNTLDCETRPRLMEAVHVAAVVAEVST